MITTNENKLKIWSALHRFLFAGVLFIVLFAITTVVLGMYNRSNTPQVQGASPPQLHTATNAKLYVMVQDWDGQNTVLVLDPDSGEVNGRFAAGYNAVVKLTGNKHILYIYNQGHSENATQLKGTVSAIDTRNGSLLWQVIAPGEPFGPSTRRAWLSANEQYLYLMGSPDNLHPHIFVVDTQRGTLLHDFELSLPYPSNDNMASPLAWKLPWSDTLVVASRNQLFTFDLITGRTGNAIQLFGPGSIQHVPLNLPHTTYIQGGTVDLETQQLFLATSTQEIFAVDLKVQPFMVTSVAALPEGWQFAVMQSFLHHPAEKAIYVQVRRSDTPRIYGGLVVEEIWTYDTSTWIQMARLDLREHLADVPALADGDADGEVNLTNYGLALSADEQTVYSLVNQGLLRLNQDTDGKLSGSWLNIGEAGMDFARIFAIP